MIGVSLIPVRLDSGLVIWHSREEYERLWRGVDPEVCAAMTAPIEDPTESEENQ